MSSVVSPSVTSLVTDREDVERLVDTVIRLMPGLVGVVVADREMRVRRVEGEVFHRHNFDAAAMMDRPLSAVLPPRAWKLLEEEWITALQGTSTELDWVSLDGVGDYLLRFSPLYATSGAVVGAVMIAQDVSAQWHSHRRLQRRADQQAAIVSLGSSALHGAALEMLAEEAASLVEICLAADVAAMLSYTPSGDVEIRRGPNARRFADAGPPGGSDAVHEFMRLANEPLLIDELTSGPLRAPRLQALGMVSVIVAPIGTVDERHGLLGASSRTSGTFSKDDLAFVEAMANILADAIDRARSAEEILRREAQLKEAQRLAAIGSWEVDLRTGEHALSPQLCDMLRVTPPMADLETTLTCVHADDRDALRDAMVTAIRNRHVEPADFRIVDLSGRVRVLRAQGAGARDEHGETVVLRGTVQDVTSQREAQHALQRSETLFRTGFDISPIGMTLVSPTTGRYLRVNAAYCRFLDRTAEELLQLTYPDVVHPDDLAIRRTVFDGHGGSDAPATETRYLRPDGSIVWGSIHASRLRGPDGEYDVFFSQVEDITARRAEQDATQRELDQVAWVKEIHAALAEDRFELYAQPIVDLATGAVVQHELLLRMHRSDGAMIAPGEFLPAAERYGVIREIDRWVVARGAEIAAGGMSVEINLSGLSMGDPALVEEIDRALERTGADPCKLVFEITETSAIEQVDTAKRLAEHLRERGCRLALDDFGTGFAGISSLKSLPLDYLKIDREFVLDLCTSATDQQVIRATITLAAAFGLKTIAEGVEDAPTLELLRELGVDLVQGYFLGRPAPISD